MRVSELAALARPPTARSLAAAAPPIPLLRMELGSQGPSTDFPAAPGAVFPLCGDNKMREGESLLIQFQLKAAEGSGRRL